jgi:hypothetical protein
LCLAIVSPSTVQGHLSEGIQSAIVHHTYMVGQLAALRAVVSSTMQSVLRCSLSKALWVDIVDEILAEFWEKAKRCSRLLYFGMRGFDWILGPPLGQVRLADRLEEAVRRLRAVQVELQVVDSELESLWNSAAQV